MWKKLVLAWYRFELGAVNFAYRRFKKIKDNPKKDDEARVGSAVMMTELIDRKQFLEKKRGIAG